MLAKSIAGISSLALAALVTTIAARSAAADELRIGFLAPVTGPFAQIAKDMRNGFAMYLDDRKGDFHGAMVKLVVEDTQGKPAVAVLKAEKLVKQDQVHVLVGGLLASTGYALAPVSTRDKVVYIASIPASDNLTQRDAG